jgi:hypothetical protein
MNSIAAEKLTDAGSYIQALVILEQLGIQRHRSHVARFGEYLKQSRRLCNGFTTTESFTFSGGIN